MTKTLKKRKMPNAYSPESIVITCLQILNAVKLYHWKTTHYSEHKATDELYKELNEKIDMFVEVLIGKNGKRIPMSARSMVVHDFQSIHDFAKYIQTIKDYLIHMSTNKQLSSPKNTDLLNIRDELLGTLNTFTYLLTLH